MSTVFHPILDNLIRDVLNATEGNAPKHQSRFSRPAANIKSFEDRIEIDLAVPGLEKSDINITIEDRNLIVSAEKETNEDTKFKRKEFNYSNFKRQFNLSETADVNNIQATMNAGILTISISKKPEQQPKKV